MRMCSLMHDSVLDARTRQCPSTQAPLAGSKSLLQERKEGGKKGREKERKEVRKERKKRKKRKKKERKKEGKMGWKKETDEKKRRKEE